VGGFTRDMSEIVDGPGADDDSGGGALRVSLGVAERAHADASGPRPVLDPEPVRRPPRAGSGWLELRDHAQRLAASAARVSSEPGEEREPPRVPPPGIGVPFANASTAAEGLSASNVDKAVARDALALDVKAVTRALPARFRVAPIPSLARAAAAERPRSPGSDKPGPAVDALKISFGPSAPKPPAEWPAPDRAIGAPEVFVDVTAVNVTSTYTTPEDE
jgi:hypothetical protein